MSSESPQDAGAHRIKRKAPPPFPYSTRYPEPDPNDPFAPLSVLRDRTATLTNLSYESPVAIPDSTPGSSKVVDLTTFIMHQRKKSAAPGFKFPSGESRRIGHAAQLRKGASMGLGLHGYSSGSEVPVITSATLRPGAREMQRHEARRRSQSVFALRSGTFSFMEPRPAPEPQVNVEPPARRHPLSPYGSRASVLTSSSTSSGESTHGVREVTRTSARSRSCSSSFVSVPLLDGVPEHSGDAVPVYKGMHVMQVDMPATHGAEDRSGSPPRHSLPLLHPLEKRSPSVSSIGSWSRDLVFYTASSRPPTPSSVRSSRPVSLPPSALLSFPHPPVNHPPAKPSPFTTSPMTSPFNRPAAPSTLATSLPPSISKSHRVSTPLQDLDALPLQLNFRFPKQEQAVESESESVELETGRFSRLRAHTSMTEQGRRSSTSSSLRSTLRAAAAAADRLASEDASIVAPPAASTPPAVTQAPAIVAERTMATGTPPTVETTLKLKEREVHAAVQSGCPAYAEQPPPTRLTTHAFPQQNPDGILPASRTHISVSVRPVHKKPDELEPIPPPKKRSQSCGSHMARAGRSTSTPMPLSRPLPSPPTITTHAEPIVNFSPTPPPRAYGHGSKRTQAQHAPLAPTSSTQGTPQLEPASHAIHVARSSSSHNGPPPGAAAPRAAHAPTPPVPHVAHPLPTSQVIQVPLPPPPPRSAQTIPVPSRTGRASASTILWSASSSSSHPDSTSTVSAPQIRRRDASPSSSHGRHSPHTSERHGYHHHHHNVAHPRSLSEPGAAAALSSAQLTQAARLPVVRENGVRVQFGELWRTQRTVVVFIRHFWCPMCQDYLASLMRDVDHAALARSGVRLVVIGCGSHGLIRSYRQIFHLPYELFVDASPGRALYRALGMGHVASGSQKARGTAENGVGSYVRHGAVSGLAMVVAHALRVGMPVWERGGDASQLGGEFVLGPGPSCTYAHRMQSTTGHAPIVDVIAAAGVRAARKDAGAAGPGSGSGLRVVAASSASGSGSVRSNISLPLERGGGGRDAKVLSVVREEACGACGACEGCAEALNIDSESTASGEWSVVMTGNGLCAH